MWFFIVVILLLIALILFLLPVIARILIVKVLIFVIKVIVIGALLYGIVKMYKVLGIRFATKTILKVVFGIILFCGIFHFVAGVLEIAFFLFW